MIHERKTFETHDNFWWEIRKMFPMLLKTKNVLIVSDEEAAIVAAMSLNLPNVDIYHCLNHVLQNTKLQLKKFGVSSKSEVGKYIQNIRELLSQPDIEHYNDLLLKMLTSWKKVRIIYSL